MDCFGRYAEGQSPGNKKYPNDPGNRLVLIDKTCRLINHLRGFLYRTLHLVGHGIWPV